MEKKREIFSQDELTFLEEPGPKEIECPMCLQVMINDPHLVSCCGHHFCGTCIRRVMDSNGACPYCKRKCYQSVLNKELLRFINGLKVNCTNKGCEWKGELKDLPAHLNKGKREGQCQYEEVTCCLNRCEIKKQRQYLEKHEKDDCVQRSYECEYCLHKDTYQYIVKEHYLYCTQYPVFCPNECGLQEIPRCNLQAHVTEECPLQSVECEFKWAGCQYTPLRKDIQQHNNDSQLEHMSLLAEECRELKRENEYLQRENAELEQMNEKLRKNCQHLQKANAEFAPSHAYLKQKLSQIHYKMISSGNKKSQPCSTQTILPVRIVGECRMLNFYSEYCGYCLSVTSEQMFASGYAVSFVVYKGRFDVCLPKVSNVAVKIDGVVRTLDKENCNSHVVRVVDECSEGQIVEEFTFLLHQFEELEVINVS